MSGGCGRRGDGPRSLLRDMATRRAPLVIGLGVGGHAAGVPGISSRGAGGRDGVSCEAYMSRRPVSRGAMTRVVVASDGIVTCKVACCCRATLLGTAPELSVLATSAQVPAPSRDISRLKDPLSFWWVPPRGRLAGCKGLVAGGRWQAPPQRDPPALEKAPTPPNHIHPAIWRSRFCVVLAPWNTQSKHRQWLGTEQQGNQSRVPSNQRSVTGRDCTCRKRRFAVCFDGNEQRHLTLQHSRKRSLATDTSYSCRKCFLTLCAPEGLGFETCACVQSRKHATQVVSPATHIGLGYRP